MNTKLNKMSWLEFIYLILLFIKKRFQFYLLILIYRNLME